MSVHKIIYRVDFKPNFGIINSPGTVMQLLNSYGDDYWTEIQDSVQTRAITAVYNSEDKTLLRQMAVEPTNINLTLQLANGVDIKDVNENEHLIRLMDLANDIRKEFKVDNLRRSGFRLFGLELIGDRGTSLNSHFESLFGPNIIGAMSKSLGKPRDYGFVIDGEHEDKTQFHFRFGPLIHDNIIQLFNFVHTKMEAESSSYNLLYDIDVYEENFALTVKPMQWTKTIVQKSHSLVSQMKAALGGVENANK